MIDSMTKPMAYFQPGWFMLKKLLSSWPSLIMPHDANPARMNEKCCQNKETNQNL